MKHTCHARGCAREIPPQLLMCSVHWRLVPTPNRLEVWKHYRNGQEIDKRPSPEYLQAMEAAIEAVAGAEARMEAARERQLPRWQS